jgi:hypothetical protein
MANKSLFLGFLVILSSAYSTEVRGLRPHPSRADYSVTCFTESIGVAATLVRPEQVRHIFSAEIDQNYIVVEVGFYSKDRSVFEVRHSDFALRNRPSRTIVKPANPKAILSVLSRPIDSIIEKTLPEVPTSQAVAGYLFFPVTEARASYYELDYTGYGAWLTLPLKP